MGKLGLIVFQVDTHAEVSSLSLTNVERALIGQVEAGEVLDLTGATLADQQVDEKTMQSWGPERTIRAAVIRDILRGRHASNPDPHGLSLRGARIGGTLDLDHLTSTIPINLAYCLLSKGMVASDATLPTVTLHECWLEHPSRATHYEPVPCVPRGCETGRYVGVYAVLLAMIVGCLRPAWGHLGARVPDRISAQKTGPPLTYRQSPGYGDLRPS